MKCEEKVVDITKHTPEEIEASQKLASLTWKFNHTEPGTEEHTHVQKELFGDHIGENSFIGAPIEGVCLDRIKVGKNVFINSGLLAMARGGITIEDDVQIAANVQILTNNHDMYHRNLLTCKPVVIRKGAWIGAGVTILPGIEIGKHAVVGAAAVVTKDVPDYAVVVGNPAKVIKTLNPAGFSD